MFSRFDNILRKVGPLLLLIPLFFRVLAQLYPPIRGTSNSTRHWVRTVLQPLLFYIAISVFRIVIYRIHLSLEKSGFVEKLPEVFRRDGNFISDHIVLGASMIAVLQIEGVMLYEEYKRRQKAFAGYHQLNNNPRWMLSRFIVVYAAALVLAALFTLITGDMFFTALHFHAPVVSSLAVGLGLIAFQLPSFFWVFYLV